MESTGRRPQRPQTPVDRAELPGQLSVDDGTVTPTFKLRRRAIDERYRELIDSLYAEGAPQTSEIT